MTKKKVGLDTTVLRRPAAKTLPLAEVETLLDGIVREQEKNRRQNREDRKLVRVWLETEDVWLAPHWAGEYFHARHRPGDRFAYLRVRLPLWVGYALLWLWSKCPWPTRDSDRERAWTK